MRKLLIGLFLVLCLAAPSALAVDTKPAVPAPAAAVVPATPAVPAPVVAAPVAEPVKPVDAAVPAANAAVPEANPPDISKIEKEDPTTFVDKIKVAYAAKEWSIVIGFILMMLVFLVVKFFWKTFPPKWIPYMSIAFGVLTDVGWQLAIGGQVWWKAILAGLTSGATGVGLWEIVGKKIFGSVTDKQAAK